MKQCPNGHNVGDNVKFCPKCGAEMIDGGAKYCAKCGNERKGTEKFCSQCGTPYDQSLTSNVTETKVKQGKSSKKGILIATVVAIIALLGGAAWYFLGNQDKYSLEGLAKAAVNYDEIGSFHEGLALVVKGDKYGFIDKMGNEVVPCRYNFLEDEDLTFHDGIAVTYEDGKPSFINKGGKEAFPCNYDFAKPFSEGLAVVMKDNEYSYIDTKGNKVIKLKKSQTGESFSDGLAAIIENGKYGFIDKKGEIVIPISFDCGDVMGEASEFHDGVAIVSKNDKEFYIDKNGKEISFGEYHPLVFVDGIAMVYKDNKYGFIDKNGKEVVPCIYDEASDFSEGYAVGKKDGKCIVIDKKGNEVLSLNYDGISSFKNGLCCVYSKDDNSLLSGYIDVHGKEIIPCIYNSFNDFSEGLALVEKDGIYGFVDMDGNSTFDVQNEAVKGIVNAKILEKEEARKEERRAEEELRKIEEENQAQNKFYNMCQNGRNTWAYQRTVFYFYPSDSKTGRVNVVYLYDNGYLGAYSGSTVYAVSDNHITFNFSSEDVRGKVYNFSFTGTLENYGNTVRIRGRERGYDECIYESKIPPIGDPFK